MIPASTILIADISGFTKFVSTTALEHSSHIINELLTLIIDENTLGLTVSEIEGDAVLFYKFGETIPCDDLVSQCISTFEAFHTRLKLIERDTICQCGTCQNVSGLGLKFVAHFGALKEIRVANFTKAAGLDMIISHRLLKNEISSDEYVLVTDAYRTQLDGGLACDLSWISATQEYSDVGVIGVNHAALDVVRDRIPDPPGRPQVVVPVGDDAVTLEIDSSLFKVFSWIIDIDRKMDWVVGLQGIENETPTARIEQRHTCVFQGMALDFELLRAEILGNKAIYSERADFQGMPFAHQQTYTMTGTDENTTTLQFEVKWGSDPAPPDEMKQQFMGTLLASFEVLKSLLEA